MIDLTSEDSLRLNVLLANAEAVRIDENAMVVYGLQGEQEMKVPLNPNARADQYLARVRELLSGQVLGSPGGYPVFLRRWTRMGQVDSAELDKLLMLGEPEAVVAVSGARSLTDELARRAWWCAPYSETARRMLANPAVAGGRMGPVLAEFLVEHLPFETEHQEMLETVRLVLQPGLIDAEARERLWSSGRTKKTYRVGFLEAEPDTLPDAVPARPELEEFGGRLEALAESGNVPAALLRKLLDVPGQTFLEVAADVMRRPADQDVYSALLDAIGGYFGPLRRNRQQLREVEAVERAGAEALAAGDPALETLREAVPALTPEVEAMLFLAHVDEALAIPVFSLTDAVGSVMRKKVEPISGPLRERFAVLRGGRG